MKILSFLITLAVVSGCASKKATETPPANRDTPVATIPAAVLKDSKAAPVIKNTNDSVPACIRKMIATFSAAAVENPPRRIVQYTYKGKTVYYVPSVCCDNFSDLYDSNCSLLGHPDGGFSGKGDGSFADFSTAATNEKLIWQDKRK